jgi:putative flippase GtrA
MSWKSSKCPQCLLKPSRQRLRRRLHRIAADPPQQQSPGRGNPNLRSARLDCGRGRSTRSADEKSAHRYQGEEVAQRVTRRVLESQFVRFCAVGASGYAVNLAVYAALLAAGLHYLVAAAIAFLVAAGSNYLWNRTWTFRTPGAPMLGQGARALVVSALSLGANQLFLFVLVAAGSGHLAGQAVAIVLATPFSFAANKLWAFAEPERMGELQPVAQTSRTRNR